MASKVLKPEWRLESTWENANSNAIPQVNSIRISGVWIRPFLFQSFSGDCSTQVGCEPLPYTDATGL